MTKKQSRLEIYVAGVVRFLLESASKQIEYPDRKISIKDTKISPNLKTTKLGKMSTESAHILNHMYNLREYIHNPPDRNDYTVDMAHYYTMVELYKLAIPTLREFLWFGLRVEFYSGISKGNFSNLIILPDWQVAGACLTNTGKLEEEYLQECLKKHFT